MDYEKLHKDTIQGLQELVAEGRITEEIAKRICADFVVESEDESIRKNIIEFLDNVWHLGKDANFDKWSKADCADWISYLEKQKETLHISKTCKENADSFTDEDEKIRKEMLEYLKRKIQNTCTPFSLASANRWIAWLEKQKEHIPSTKETELNSVAFLEQMGYTCIPPSEEPKEQKPIDLSEMMVHKEPYIAPVPTPIVADEQKLAEWSEEDKSKLSALLNMLTVMRKLNSNDIIVGVHSKKDREKRFNEIESWLKSLRPQPHWKPSEEQMEAMDYVVGKFKGPSNLFDNLMSLYEQLKQL